MSEIIEFKNWYSKEEAAEITKKNIEEIDALINQDVIEIEKGLISIDNIFYIMSPKNLKKIDHEFIKDSINKLIFNINTLCTERKMTEDISIKKSLKNLDKIYKDINTGFKKRRYLKTKFDECKSISKEICSKIMAK